jgi:branched-chain amino acid transport system ATP-binding protein
MSVILETRGLTRRFGAVVAADAIDVTVDEGRVVGMIGPNGAGKTTFLNIVTGYVRPDRGTVHFRGRDVTGMPPRALAALGLTRSFQIPQLFPTLTVLENVMLAQRIAAGGAREFWRPLHTAGAVEAARDVLARFRLGDAAGQVVATLPEGGRKLLDIALALVRRPGLLLLDEPTSGVSVEEKFDLFDVLIGVLRADRVTTIFVEHDMEVVSRYADEVLAFADGRVLARGTPAAVLADPQVRRLVVGAEDEAAC